MQLPLVLCIKQVARFKFLCWFWAPLPDSIQQVQKGIHVKNKREVMAQYWFLFWSYKSFTFLKQLLLVAPAQLLMVFSLCGMGQFLPAMRLNSDKYIYECVDRQVSKIVCRLAGLLVAAPRLWKSYRKPSSDSPHYLSIVKQCPYFLAWYLISKLLLRFSKLYSLSFMHVLNYFKLVYYF